VARGARRVSLDSSGNAGLAVAAAARRAGLDAVVRVGPGISPAKEALIAATGARVEKFPDRAAAVRACAGDADAYDASHVRNPLFRRGISTLARAWAAKAAIPDRIVLPVGNGSLLLGLWEGFAAMRRDVPVAQRAALLLIAAMFCCLQLLRQAQEEAQFRRRQIVRRQDTPAVKIHRHFRCPS